MGDVIKHPHFHRHRSDEALAAVFDPENRYKKFVVIGVIDDIGNSQTEWAGHWTNAEALFYVEQLKNEIMRDA